MSAPVRCTVDELAAAMVASASSARWPDGSLLLDLDEQVLRTQVLPRLVAALPTSSTPTASSGSS